MGKGECRRRPPSSVSSRAVAKQGPPEVVMNQGERLAAARQLAHQAAHPDTNLEDWTIAISEAETESLIAALGGIAALVPSAERSEAFRDQVRLLVEQRLTDRMVAKMEDLERASARLARVGLGVGVVGAVAGIVAAIAGVLVVL